MECVLKLTSTKEQSRIIGINRNERTRLFMLYYSLGVYRFSSMKRIECYLYAENNMIGLTGKRQYNNYSTFRASLSRYERTKRKVKSK
jgi:hypothetical protein